MTMEQKQQGRCVFCDGKGLTHEHVWDQWIQELLPTGWDRYQVLFVAKSEDSIFDARNFSEKKKQGAVHTLSARRFCAKCNNEWMSQIGNKAKPIASQLIAGNQIDILPDMQPLLASWIALSAVAANQLTQGSHKLPASDHEYIYKNKKPPPHWYVLIGYYNGTSPPVNFEFSSAAIRDGADGHIVMQVLSFAATLGHLFTQVIVHTPAQHPGMELKPVSIVNPHLVPIWPTHHGILRFPPPPGFRISGGLWVNGGGLARELSTRYTRFFKSTMEGLAQKP